MQTILLKNLMLHTVVDDIDYNILNQYKWGAYYSNYKDYYVRGVVDKKQVAIHRLITNCPKGLVVDHINHNTLDNRRCNLRVCTNKYNKNSNHKYRSYKGVFRDKNGWTVIFTHKQHSLNLGLFDNPIDAALTYDNAVRTIANTNEGTNFQKGFPEKYAMIAAGDDLNKLCGNYLRQLVHCRVDYVPFN